MNAQVVEVGGKMLEAPGALLPSYLEYYHLSPSCLEYDLLLPSYLEYYILPPENHYWKTLLIKMLEARFG